MNLATRTPATHMLVVRHRDKPGVLAHVFDQLRAAAINVQETENVIFAGAEAAVARINLDGRPSDAVLALITSGNEHVLSVQIGGADLVAAFATITKARRARRHDDEVQSGLSSCLRASRAFVIVDSSWST